MDRRKRLLVCLAGLSICMGFLLTEEITVQAGEKEGHDFMCSGVGTVLDPNDFTVDEPEKQQEEGYAAILHNIRRANDEIADPELSAKINRLEEISAKIFRIVEEDPKRKKEIATFLDYYLPTTQKLLDAYGDFEAAGVEGENLREAKKRIEQIMDAVVAGFERQLDQLYHSDAMDINSEVQVMETMLKRDGSSVEEDFFGATAVQEKTD